MKKFEGTWLMINDAYTYCYPMFIKFEKDQVNYFELSEKDDNGHLEIKQKFSKKLSKTKFEFINESRIRIYSIGTALTVISDTESISEETEFATDYERIESTKTDLTENEIQKMDLEAEWNGEKIPIVFNKNLDSPTIQKVNKRLKREGQKMVLEYLQGTYFASIYGNGERRTLIGIKHINNGKAVLFGFPKKPYEVIAYSEGENTKHNKASYEKPRKKS